MRHLSLLASIVDPDDLLVTQIVPTARSVAARPKTKDMVALVETKCIKVLENWSLKIFLYEIQYCSPISCGNIGQNWGRKGKNAGEGVSTLIGHSLGEILRATKSQRVVVLTRPT